MQTKPAKRLYAVILLMPTGDKRLVKVKATTLDVAERRARKFVPGNIGVVRD